MKRLVVVVALLLAVASAVGCSSGSGVCEAIESGQDPVVAAGASYSALGNPARRVEQAERLREAAEEIRSDCPENTNDALRLENVAGAAR